MKLIKKDLNPARFEINDHPKTFYNQFQNQIIDQQIQYFFAKECFGLIYESIRVNMVGVELDELEILF
jgi:hypothetical protein